VRQRDSKTGGPVAQTSDQPVRLYLTGPFRIEGAGGQDMTPVSAKAQGLLALLATGPHLTRQRTWLQDKLWSDSPAALGAASLRQALTQIRRSLGDQRDLLTADRRLVRLDPARVRILRDGPGEFLEGIDMRDPEFEHWLAAMRQAEVRQADPTPGAPPDRANGTPVPRPPPRTAPDFSTPPQSSRQPRPRRQLFVEITSPADGRMGLIEAQFADAVCLSLREICDFDARRRPLGGARPGALALSVHAYQAGADRIGLRLAVYGPAGEAPIWAASHVAALPDHGHGFGVEHLNLAHRATSALIDLLSQPLDPRQPGSDADFLAGMGLRKMFSMRTEDLDLAERLFIQADEIEPRGLFLAWRAQLAVIRLVESGGDVDRQGLADQSAALCAEAMQREPTNSNVLAAVANARLVLEGDGVAARELSRLGVTANPANPLAWWSWANGLLYTGDAKKAHAAARTAQMLARNGSFRFWTDFQVALTSAVTGDLDGAIAHAEVSRALNPAFRPPLRYLLALLAKTGQDDAARLIRDRLERAEPGFSVDRMIDDPAYPVSMMRKAGLIDPSRLRDL
jgi:hypothetical protein